MAIFRKLFHSFHFCSFPSNSDPCSSLQRTISTDSWSSQGVEGILKCYTSSFLLISSKWAVRLRQEDEGVLFMLRNFLSHLNIFFSILFSSSAVNFSPRKVTHWPLRSINVALFNVHRYLLTSRGENLELFRLKNQFSKTKIKYVEAKWDECLFHPNIFLQLRAELTLKAPQV